MLSRLFISLFLVLFSASAFSKELDLPQINNGVATWILVLTSTEAGSVKPVKPTEKTQNIRWAESTNEPTAYCRSGNKVDPNDPPYFGSGTHNNIWMCSTSKAARISVNKSTDVTFEN